MNQFSPCNRDATDESFDDSQSAAAAVNGDAARLVDHDQRLVFIDNRGFEPLQQALGQRHGFVALRHANRRHAHDIARLQLVFGLDPAFVHSHFAFTQNAVNQSLGHAFEPSEKEVINTLAGIFRRDLKQLYGWGRGGSSRHGADDINFLWN